MATGTDFANRAFQMSTTDDAGTESLTPSTCGPRVRISNEPELRLRIKELDDNSKEWLFLPYAEEEKGLLESQ